MKLDWLIGSTPFAVAAEGSVHPAANAHLVCRYSPLDAARIFPSRSTISLSMNLVDRANRQRSLAAMSRTLRSGRIAANASVPQSTYSYDSNGNLTSGAGWGYTWDYLNRMLSAGFGNSTTTYAYDPAGNRVLQTSTTSTNS